MTIESNRFGRHKIVETRSESLPLTHDGRLRTCTELARVGPAPRGWLATAGEVTGARNAPGSGRLIQLPFGVRRPWGNAVVPDGPILVHSRPLARPAWPRPLAGAGCDPSCPAP